MSESNEPREVLFDISSKVSEIHDRMDGDDLPSEPRSKPNCGSKRHRIIEVLDTTTPMSSGELCDEMGGEDVTGALRRLYDSYLVDRHHSGNSYKYEINRLGEKVLEGIDDEQTEETLVDPWDGTDLNRGEYIAVKLVDEYDGHPRGKDLEKSYLEKMDRSESNSTAYRVSARLTNVFQGGYVDRTPTQPYRYWVTEEGKEVLDQ